MARARATQRQRQVLVEEAEGGRRVLGREAQQGPVSHAYHTVACTVWAFQWIDALISACQPGSGGGGTPGAGSAGGGTFGPGSSGWGDTGSPRNRGHTFGRAIGVSAEEKREIEKRLARIEREGQFIDELAKMERWRRDHALKTGPYTQPPLPRFGYDSYANTLYNRGKRGTVIAGTSCPRTPSKRTAWRLCVVCFCVYGAAHATL